MKRKTTVLLIIAWACLLSLTGCSQAHSAQAANELHFDLTNRQEVSISYDEEPITFFQTNGTELIVKEFMTKRKKQYYANVKQSSDSIHISEGGKPVFKDGFSRYIEIYFPEKYQGNLTVTTSNGNIDMSGVDLKLSSLRIDSTSGTVRLNSAEAPVIFLSSTSGTLELGNLTGGQIRLETTSGAITCENLRGAVTYTSTSGDIDVKAAAGSGTYQATNSGKLKAAYSLVTGDLSFYNKNDSIYLMLPKDLEFEFEAITKNGSVITSFDDSILTDGHTRKTVGDLPAVTVKTETKNGTIEVVQ